MTSASESARLARVAQEHAGSRGWIALLQEALRETVQAGWADVVPGAGPAETRAGAPLLAGVRMVVDGGLAKRWMRRLLGAAVGIGTPAATLGAAALRLDAVDLLEAALEDDERRLKHLALDAGADAAALRAVAPLLAMPALHACRAAWATRLPVAWREGYCPVCGAWPMLAELRGLERARHLRCGRCGSSWATDWLRCPFCGNDDHETLRSLLSEDSRESRRVDACGKCRGYVKTQATLTASSPTEVMVEDVVTVAWDICALAEGYLRPSGAGHHLGVTVQAGVRGRRRGWWR
ncbi:MAG: formate dehydrogenase accessory protein FdhE [Candidatus Rokubacteria bacterium]|nr:formate dehydrogenase accessory protein FdhE [Candidatus Rokubacteria bacterium]